MSNWTSSVDDWPMSSTDDRRMSRAERPLRSRRAVVRRRPKRSRWLPRFPGLRVGSTSIVCPEGTERFVWADNETDVDLLGFDFLVDALVVALTEPRLLPLTVGVLGDWGSGKSSLMRIVRQELEAIGGPDDPDRQRYACVRFSP